MKGVSRNRWTRWAASLCALLLVAGLQAAEPVAHDLKVERAGGTLTLEGEKPQQWGTLRYPAPATPDVQIQGSFRILQPSTSFSPPASYWPLNYHYLVNEPGYDFAILARSQSAGVFYRVQFSSRWNEVSLWKEGEPGIDPQAPTLPTGFFAAVRSQAQIRRDRDHTFSLRVVGDALELSVDGQVVLQYEDKVLPLTEGDWGVAAFHGARVTVSDLGIAPATGAIAVPQVERPNFQVRSWHRGNGEAEVIFDGDEPIAAKVQGTAAWLTDVKFRPGYRAQIAWPMVFENRHRTSRWQQLEGTPEKVTGRVTAARQAFAALDGATTFELTYDPASESYQYLMDVDITLKQDNSESNILNRQSVYYLNTYPYNAMRTIDDGMGINFENWSTASSPYRTGLVRGHDGQVYRWPIHHFYGSFIRPGFSGGSYWQNWAHFGLADDSFLVMYPEPVICPTVDTLPIPGRGDRNVFDSCNQYWDMHFWSKPAEGTAFVAGYQWQGRFRIRGMPAAEADALAAQSQLLPSFDPAIQRPYYVEGVNRFDHGGNIEETSARLIFEGRGQWETSVGRDDSHSLRMENAGNTHVYIGYNGASAAAKQVRLRLWVKTEAAWSGEGIRLGIEGRGRFGGTDRQWGDYVQPVAGQWTEVVYDVPFPTYNVVCVWFQTSGQGTLWIDDFEYQRIEE